MGLWITGYRLFIPSSPDLSTAESPSKPLGIQTIPKMSRIPEDTPGFHPQIQTRRTYPRFPGHRLRIRATYPRYPRYSHPHAEPDEPPPGL
ncbi:protein of unknown function [Rhodovastum atsumiense]|nr:protein of unknown function [Rhodovastum atsumiense]